MNRHPLIRRAVLVILLLGAAVAFVWPGPFNYEPDGPVPFTAGHVSGLFPPEVLGYSDLEPLPGAGMLRCFPVAEPERPLGIVAPVVLLLMSWILIALIRWIRRRLVSPLPESSK